MRILLSGLVFFLSISDANAFFNSKKKEKELVALAAKDKLCKENAINYTYRGIQEKYSHWEYNPKDFSSNFSYVEPNENVLVVHVREKHYRFEHKIILDNETCDVLGHESFAF